ncbi:MULTISPECIES: conserved phage C-terminal domain-containing protein [unclassified Herbaspirillum]|uniref:conserved phage C-terminal domain-containing protein n=1 Tax=unclassified Herbaspirillum TaxID=2624150 RepID=UPI000C0AB6A0|nr:MULTISPECIES: conserved phage C-terminal domain-containing protein [unclassified Herbaspirillum]MAF04936.1 hypothetical protein [Herbaspirillum sp.]MBO18484.1 hypothetical protein [Herbaspirillum sp.]|tara:strand:- start:1985 stop:2686 length:702 start_codon:yes stop_codon:yes gene_type:complete
MARIRSIKPDFWTDEKIVELSMEQRLFFIGSWNFADDSGNLQRSAKKLKMQIFPADAIDCEPIILDLIAHGLLIEYEVNGEKYLHIKGFDRHQVINRPSKSGLPKPSEEQNQLPLTESSLTEGKGKEGKGIKTLSGNSPDVLAVLDHLNEKTGKAYRAVEANTKLIAARLRESSLDDCIRVIDLKAGEWLGDPKMEEYLRPATLFGATKFAQYVGQLGGVNGSPSPFSTDHLR